MKEYVFVLGKDKDLSFLEIICYFKARNIIYTLLKRDENLLFLLLPDLNFNKLINDLGGTIKIGEEIKKFDNLFFKNKIIYGVEFYKDKKILDFLKNEFRKEKIKAFYKKPKDKMFFNPSESNRLDVELLVHNKFYKVIAISNPKSYKERDEKRPCYDKLKVSSIRLAKILVNLSFVKENEVLLDPFCGLGTVLQEALLMGINVIGSDKDKRSVEDCRENLEWLKKKYNFKRKYKILRLDSANLEGLEKFDGIATEPYLGPYFKKLPQYEEAKKIAENLEEMYLKFLKAGWKILKENGKIALIVPVFRTFERTIPLRFDRILKDTGFKIFDVKGITMPLKYSIKGNKIRRLIYILEKNSKL